MLIVEAIPASIRQWVYHMTPTRNFEAIKEYGLIPQYNTGKFGCLSSEAKDSKAKIFLLPILGGLGMKGFLSEWWHGDKKQIIIFRIPFNVVKNPLSSRDPYYARQEIWTHYSIHTKNLQYRRILDQKWRSI